MDDSENFAATINHFAKVVYQNALDKGFHADDDSSTQNFVPAHIANLHGEVSELWEAYRVNSLHHLCDKSAKMSKMGMAPLTNAEEELADIIIRALDTSATLNIDIGNAILIKHAYNAQREYKHGGKLV